MSVRANRSQGGTGAVASEGAAVLKKERQASFQQVKEGTQEWFENARRRCVDHLRALISVRAASTYASAILDRWSNEDIEILAGLHLASVIAYTRPFTSAFT